MDPQIEESRKGFKRSLEEIVLCSSCRETGPELCMTKAAIIDTMAQTAQTGRPSTLSEEHFNTPLGEINIPAPRMILNKNLFHGNILLPFGAEDFLSFSFS